MNHRLPACRSCENPALEMVLSLGAMPLANALLTAEELHQPEPTYPLELAFCPECRLVQLTETVPPEKLFTDYLYFSSFSDTMLHHSRELVHRLIRARGLGRGSLVVEVGSNDGYLLQYFRAEGVPVLGIEPAQNVARVAEAKGIRTLCAFFGEGLAQELSRESQYADVLIANNVLAHVADLNGFVKGIRLLLKDDGVAVIEVPYVRDLIDRCEFDTIYHEHLCYFSVTALDRLFAKHGLALANVERIAIHGGSLRLFVCPGQSASSDAVKALLEEEAALGMDRVDFYLHFGQKVGQIKASLRSRLESLKDRGQRIAAYGAAAKGTTLLNFCGLGKELLDFVVDRSPYKQGRYMPGVHLPIGAPSRLLEEKPDYTLLLVWNIAGEILEQQAEYRRGGGQFIIPIPSVEIV